MKIEILAVGSELLTPFFQDTNSLYLTQRLNDLGLAVSKKTIVGDEREALSACIRQAIVSADLIFVMGGLGPTEDDVTREVCAETVGRKLVFSPEILEKIKERFKRRGKEMPPSNKKQAFVIEGAEVLDNTRGTAPGLWLTHGRARIALLPGPPPELRPMFEKYVWAKLKAWQKGFMFRTTLKIAGLTESEVEGRIAGLYPEGPDVRLTVLASPGQIEIHLESFSGKDILEAETNLKSLSEEIQRRLGDDIFSTSGEELEEVVGNLLRQQRKTLATAESCTGGLLANRITNISGSSEYFLEGFIPYGNPAKIRTLDFPMDLIQTHGAVSSEVALAMAAGARVRAQADYGLALTGIAGPKGGSPEKPVGLVYAALACAAGSDVQKNIFLGTRDQVKFQSSQKALDMLRRFLQKTNIAANEARS
jgi:nicotinamide-nucleotide amidase